MPLPRVVNGMHAPNRRMWDVEKCIASARGTGCITILHHLMFQRDTVADQFGDFENAYWYGKLRWGHAPQGIPPAPELLIHVRMFHPDWRALDPKAWAAHTVKMLSNWQDPDGRRANLLDDPFVCVSPANEQDIESRAPGTGANSVAEYKVIGQWCLDWVREFDRLTPGRKCLTAWPAFAGGHDAIPDDPDSEYGVPEVKAAMALYDLGAVHLYGHAEWGPIDGPPTLPGGVDAFWHMLRAFRPAGWRDTHQPSPTRPRDRGGFCAQFPGKPFVVSESGTFGHADKALTAQTLTAWRGLLEAAVKSGACLGVTPFIWNSDAAHPTNTIWDNEELRNAAPNIPPYATGARVPVRGAHPGPSGPAPTLPPPAVPPPTSTVAGVEPRIQVLKGDGWTSIARRALGREPKVKEVTALAAANPGVTGPPANVWVRSPWHKVERM